MPFKEYRDPLYGFVGVNEVEQRIIDSAPFQRLRHIAQLGTTSWVYPSACHSRFEHSLGVLHASSLLFDHLVSREQSMAILDWDADTTREMRALLRLAALLHDVGHPPFSHTSEELLGGLKHEEYTRLIVVQTEIGHILEKHMGKGAAEKGANAATGSGLLTKDQSFISSVLTGDIGTDRFDYLIRDSYHLGVAYGHFDFRRLLGSLHLRYNPEKRGPELALDGGGFHSAEGLLLARYFMFLEVYFHKTRRVLDYHLRDCLKDILLEGKYPARIDDYLTWDDHKVLSILAAKRNLAPVARLLRRRHFRCVFETSDHPENGELSDFDWLQERLLENFGNRFLFFDEAVKDPLNYREPPLPILRGSKYESLANVSALVRQLRTIRKGRIYTDLRIRSRAERFCSDFVSGRKQKQSERAGKGA